MISRQTLELAHGVSIGFSSAAGLLGLVALCVFAAQTAQEYTYGTLRNLLVRQPRRLTLLFGKFVAMKSFALITVLVSALVAVGLAFALSNKANVREQETQGGLLSKHLSMYLSQLLPTAQLE